MESLHLSNSTCVYSRGRHASTLSSLGAAEGLKSFLLFKTNWVHTNHLLISWSPNSADLDFHFLSYFYLAIRRVRHKTKCEVSKRNLQRTFTSHLQFLVMNVHKLLLFVYITFTFTNLIFFKMQPGRYKPTSRNPWHDVSLWYVGLLNLLLLR